MYLGRDRQDGTRAGAGRRGSSRSCTPVFDGTTSSHTDDVNRFPLDLLPTAETSSPPDPGHGPITRAEEVLDHDLLVLVSGMVRADHVREPLYSSDQALAEPLVVQVPVGDDRRGFGRVARGKHRNHRRENVNGGWRLHVNILAHRPPVLADAVHPLRVVPDHARAQVYSHARPCV